MNNTVQTLYVDICSPAPTLQATSLSDTDTDSDSEDETEDPLMMRPIPPRERVPAVPAVIPEKVKAKCPKSKRHRSVIQPKSAVAVSLIENTDLQDPPCSLEIVNKTEVKEESPHLSPVNEPYVNSPSPVDWLDDNKMNAPPNIDNLNTNPSREDDLTVINKKNNVTIETDLDLNNVKTEISINDTHHKDRKKKKKMLNYNYACEYVCNRPHCRFVAANRSDLNSHKRSVHRNTKDFQCDQCAYRAVAAADLRKHYRLHSGESPFECPHDGCNFRGKHSNSLDYHKKKVHPTGEPLRCEHLGCQFSTFMAPAMKTHRIKNHSGGKTIACDLCPYRCFLMAELRKHLRTHSNETPYACDYPGCGYACKISSNLRKHRRIHTEERPYACDVCAFRSNFISSLKAHKRTHTNERPYCCEQCGYRCNSASNLKKHILQRHPGTVYALAKKPNSAPNLPSKSKMPSHAGRPKGGGGAATPPLSNIPAIATLNNDNNKINVLQSSEYLASSFVAAEGRFASQLSIPDDRILINNCYGIGQIGLSQHLGNRNS